MEGSITFVNRVYMMYMVNLNWQRKTRIKWRWEFKLLLCVRWYLINLWSKSLDPNAPNIKRRTIFHIIFQNEGISDTKSYVNKYTRHTSSFLLCIHIKIIELLLIIIAHYDKLILILYLCVTFQEHLKKRRLMRRTKVVVQTLETMYSFCV